MLPGGIFVEPADRGLGRSRGGLTSKIHLAVELLEVFPALERALDLTNKGPVMLLTGYQTPAAIRRTGAKRIENWLKNRKVKGAAALACTAVDTSEAQHTTLPGERLAAAMVVRLAKGVTLDEEIAERLSPRPGFTEHPHAEVIRSLPGMNAFGSADRLAGFAGLAPQPRDSGRVSGNLHRPRRYHRGLLRAMYLSALASLKCCPASKAYYQRKRSEGKGHKQALLALARRRVNALWAIIRDRECYQVSLLHRWPPERGGC